MDLPRKCLRFTPCLFSARTLPQVATKMYNIPIVKCSTSGYKVKYSSSKEDFNKWVYRLLPPSQIPTPPKADSYPTPSGWSPPAGNFIIITSTN